MAGVTVLHPVDRIGHRDMHDRQCSKLRVAPTLAALNVSNATTSHSVTTSARAPLEKSVKVRTPMAESRRVDVRLLVIR